ncbi:hypothetical protein GCM10009117_00030 [Gangjinia marincola]|uniref:OmpA-like domain-containing protein n=1 Tax=Gangjinia marincola TaxID=578463 RepID=A0ABP3XR54_9FLAO
MQLIKKGVLLITFSISLISYGQKLDRKLEPVNEKYERFEYADAIKIYKYYINKGYESEELFRRLANSYYFIVDFENAAIYYDKLFKLNPNQDAEHIYRYALSLKTVGEYDKADEQLLRINEKRQEDIRVNEYLENKNYLQDILNMDEMFAIKDVGINSRLSDFGPSFYKDQLVFASNREGGVANVVVHKWNNQPFLDLYYSKMDDKGLETGVVKLNDEINTKFHESTTAFTKDGKYMYFTRNNFYGDDYKESEEGINLLKIFRATNVNGTWTNVVELPFSSDNYSVAHPALSPDETKLYFASDMPGTLGQSDIFMVEITGDNTYGEPVNLGKEINTEAKESFPFISKEGTLYFSSTGHPGLGGFDTFYALRTNDEFSQPMNAGEPINGKYDDFGLIIDDDLNIGYFASNRPGGEGDDDILGFTRLVKPPKEELEKIDVEVVEEVEEEPKLVFTSGDRLNKYFDLDDSDPIYFNFDKSNIRSEAAPKLDKIVKVLTDNPEINLIIKSHTDIRGSKSYNEALSKRRAESTKKYLVNAGIDANRLDIDWFGENQPSVRCDVVISCKEEQHLLNRRSEFFIK